MLSEQEHQAEQDTLLGVLSAALLTAVASSVLLVSRRRGGRTFPVPKPGPITLLAKEQKDMTKFAYILGLPAPANISDVVRRKLIATPAPGTEQEAATVSVEIPDPSNPESPEIILDSGVNYYVTLVDYDQAGNASAPSDPLIISVVDDVAPSQPQQVNVVSKRQFDDPVPDPDPYAG